MDPERNSESSHLRNPIASQWLEQSFGQVTSITPEPTDSGEGDSLEGKQSTVNQRKVSKC